MNTKLQEAFTAVQSLPKMEQEVIAHELLEEVLRYSGSSLTQEQVAIVQDRLSKPFVYATEQEVERVVGKY